MFDLLRLVAYGHFIEDDTEGPHVHGRRYPSLIGHLGCLVVVCTDTNFHEGLLLLRIDQVAESKVADLSDWALFHVLISLLYALLFKDKNIVYFDVGVNDPALVHVIYGR